MGELHEILAVEKSLETVAKKLIAESKKTFGKPQLFSGAIKKLHLFDDKLSHLETSDEIKLDTTVNENLEYTFNEVAKYWDAVAQKDLANQSACADVVVDGKIILQNMPATTLLGLEAKLNEIRKLFDAIPTLQPGKDWSIDESNKMPHVYKSGSSDIKHKTETFIEPVVLYEATKEHPAVVKEVSKVNIVGEYKTDFWSGMVSPHTKAKWLLNLEKVLVAVKQARQRANKQKVEPVIVGSAIFDFIMK